MTQLLVQNITKEFPTRSEPLVVLRDVSLTLAAGENLAIVGPSGSGKSTLLHIVGGLDAPTAGSVELAGENPFALSEQKLAHFRNANIGFVFQDHHLLPQLNVLDNVLLPAVAEGSPSEAISTRAKDLISRVGLAERMTHLPSELSGGEKQRAAVARALLMKPALILADEPTGSLDQKNAEQIADLLTEMQTAENAMLIVVTHSRELAERMQNQRQFVDGQLVE